MLQNRKKIVLLFLLVSNIVFAQTPTIDFTSLYIEVDEMDETYLFGDSTFSEQSIIQIDAFVEYTYGEQMAGIEVVLLNKEDTLDIVFVSVLELDLKNNSVVIPLGTYQGISQSSILARIRFEDNTYSEYTRSSY